MRESSPTRRSARGLVNARLPEVWGGVECSVVRVGDVYRDSIVVQGTIAAPRTSRASHRSASPRSASRCCGAYGAGDD